MKRVIKDYNNITDEHAALIQAAYPNGFENEHLVSFTTPKGAFIKALEIRTEDTIYLFKIDKNMKVVEEDVHDDGLNLNDLDGLITKSKKLLANQGHVALVCHDRFSIVNRILREKSPIFDIEHLQILNKVGVKLLLERHGFVDVKVRPISNKYPIAYWLLLLPIPKVVKHFIDVRRDNWYFSWGVRIRVGNLIAVGKQASE